jgi:hypothetical protein
METQQLLDLCLKKPYVDYSTSIADLENFYKQLTGSEYPFLMQSGEQVPTKRIKDLCRILIKLDFKGAPLYSRVVLDMIVSCLEQGDNMYVIRMVEMFVESLDYIPSYVPVGLLFGDSESPYQQSVVPFVKNFHPQAMPVVTDAVNAFSARIASKELMPSLTDVERSKCVDLIRGSFEALDEKAKYVEEHSVTHLFKNKPEIVSHIKNNAYDLTQSPAVGIFKFMDFDDDMDYMNSAIAVFTEEHMAFLPKKLTDGIFKKAGRTFTWRLSSVVSLSVGTEHSVVHFGYDSNNWEKIHLTWTFRGGTVITTTICSGMSKDESRTFFNQRIQPLLGQLANYFPVTLDGGHIERSSGYRTSVSFGVWI